MNFSRVLNKFGMLEMPMSHDVGLQPDAQAL
jgi:hypothetical protein